MVEFLPAAFKIPFEIIAPIRDRTSSYLFVVILSNSFLIVATFGS